MADTQQKIRYVLPKIMIRSHPVELTDSQGTILVSEDNKALQVKNVKIGERFLIGMPWIFMASHPQELLDVGQQQLKTNEGAELMVANMHITNSNLFRGWPRIILEIKGLDLLDKNNKYLMDINGEQLQCLNYRRN